MGFLKNLRRQYENAGAQVKVQLQTVKSLAEPLNEYASAYAFECTGLNIHNRSRSFRRKILNDLRSKPEYRGAPLQEVYWRVALRTVLLLLKDIPLDKTHDDALRSCLCVVIESAMKGYTPGMKIRVRIAVDGETEVWHGPGMWVERLPLGNVNTALEKLKPNV